MMNLTFRNREERLLLLLVYIDEECIPMVIDLDWSDLIFLISRS